MPIMKCLATFLRKKAGLFPGKTRYDQIPFFVPFIHILGDVMRKTAISLLICTLSGISISASAAEHMKQGLWEMTMKNEEMAKQMEQLKKMPPQQLEQMKKMGISLPQSQDGAMVSKVCISKAMSERDQPPAEYRKTSGCESKNFQRSGNSYSVDIVCDGPTMQGTGKVKGTMSGNTGYTSVYDFKGTSHGKPVNQHIESSGKWVGADCGNVKPADEMLADIKKRKQ